jgi:hypothetical protein
LRSAEAPLNRDAKVRVMMVARALMRHQEKGKAYGKISAKALAVLTALLWRFHNAATGKCFPVIRRDRRGRPLRQEYGVRGDPRPRAGRRPVLRESHQERSRVRPPPVRQLVQRRCAEPGRRHSFQVGWALARLAGKAESAAKGRSNRENRGARNPMQRRCMDQPISRFRRVADRRSSSKPTSGPWCSTRARWEIRRKINGLGRKPLFLEGD